MTTALDDPIEVELVDELPSVFWWERFAYVVHGLPQAFYRRVQQRWWAGEGDPSRLDTEFWRVSASRDGHDGEECLYDLRRDPDGWRLVLRWG